MRLGGHPTERSTGVIVDAQLEKAAERTGLPRQIVSDHGGDVKKGSELFAQRHPDTVVTYDAAHHGAIVLQRRFKADKRWPEFVARLGHVKACIQQTNDAFLLAPSLRPQARYMNLASLLRWPVLRIKAALEATPVKHVVEWGHKHLTASVQSQRRMAFAVPADVNKS